MFYYVDNISDLGGEKGMSGAPWRGRSAFCCIGWVMFSVVQGRKATVVPGLPGLASSYETLNESVTVDTPPKVRSVN